MPRHAWRLKTSMKKSILRALLVDAFALAFAGLAFGQSNSIVALPNTFSIDNNALNYYALSALMNNHGTVVGVNNGVASSWNSNTGAVAMTGAPNSFIPTSINNNGIAGLYDPSGSSGGSLYNTNTSSSTMLPSNIDTYGSVIVNDNGDVSASSYSTPGALFMANGATSWTAYDTGINGVGPTDLNNNGVVSGYDIVNPVSGLAEPFTYTQAGGVNYLPVSGNNVFPNAGATALNNNANYEVVGWGSPFSGSEYAVPEAWTYMKGASSVNYIPLLDPTGGSLEGSLAFSVNDMGWVAGMEGNNVVSLNLSSMMGFLYVPGLGNLNLNNYIPQGSGWSSVYAALSVNDNKQILIEGDYNGSTQLGVMTVNSVPEPSCLASLSGLGLLLIRKRRK